MWRRQIPLPLQRKRLQRRPIGHLCLQHDPQQLHLRRPRLLRLTQLRSAFRHLMAHRHMFLHQHPCRQGPRRRECAGVCLQRIPLQGARSQMPQPPYLRTGLAQVRIPVHRYLRHKHRRCSMHLLRAKTAQTRSHPGRRHLSLQQRLPELRMSQAHLSRSGRNDRLSHWHLHGAKFPLAPALPMCPYPSAQT